MKETASYNNFFSIKDVFHGVHKWSKMDMQNICVWHGSSLHVLR